MLELKALLDVNLTRTLQEHSNQQLFRLNDELTQKRPSVASDRRKVIPLHDNARPHVARTVKETLEWEVLPYPDLAPSDYHLF